MVQLNIEKSPLLVNMVIDNHIDEMYRDAVRYACNNGFYNACGCHFNMLLEWENERFFIASYSDEGEETFRAPVESYLITWFTKADRTA